MEFCSSHPPSASSLSIHFFLGRSISSTSQELQNRSKRLSTRCVTVSSPSPPPLWPSLPPPPSTTARSALSTWPAPLMQLLPVSQELQDRTQTLANNSSRSRRCHRRRGRRAARQPRPRAPHRPAHRSGRRSRKQAGHDSGRAGRHARGRDHHRRHPPAAREN